VQTSHPRLWKRVKSSSYWYPQHTESFLVLKKDSKAPMTHAEVLTLVRVLNVSFTCLIPEYASPWITQFLYDNRRIVAHSMDDPRIFVLGKFFGLAQRYSIMILLQMFTRPNVYLLPIEVSRLNSLSQVLNPCFSLQANGFATFLTHQMTKEMVYHIVFRTTTTSRIHLTIADLEPATSRNAPHLPVDTLALVGSCVSAFCSLGILFHVYHLVLSSITGKTCQYVGHSGRHAQLPNSGPDTC
jgi:hypothetical protein